MSLKPTSRAINTESVMTPCTASTAIPTDSPLTHTSVFATVTDRSIRAAGRTRD